MAESFERLITTEMPYGKYKGTLIADLPGSYLNYGYFALVSRYSTMPA